MYVFISLFIAVAAHPNLRQLTHEFRASIDSIDKTDDLDAWVNEANRYITESLSDLSTNNQGQNDLDLFSKQSNQGQNDLDLFSKLWQQQTELSTEQSNQGQNDLFSKQWQQQTDIPQKQSPRGPGFWPT